MNEQTPEEIVFDPNKVQPMNNTSTKVDKKDVEATFMSQPQSMTVKGALIGAAITTFISWNSGRYNRLGLLLKRWKLVRYFVSPKPSPNNFMFQITNYHNPFLNTVANNFYCYSGEPGIGKSFHFQHMIARQSFLRPSLYISFKSVGRESNFENDISEQLNFGEQGHGMIAQIIRAVKHLQQINQNPLAFKLKFALSHALFITAYFLLFQSNILLSVKLGLAGATFLSQIYYNQLMGPIFTHSFRKTVPVVVFDDLNKIEQMNMLAEIVRFLKLVQQQAVNIILVSSDQETWSRLRRQPGMKDRLRVRQIKYDYIQTANRINQALDKDPQTFKRQILAHEIFDKMLMKAMVRDLIALRQMSLRRFISVMRLVDQQFYQVFLQILKNPKQLPVTEVTQQLRQVLLDSQAQTMVSNLKIIKRQLQNIPTKQFIQCLQLLIKKQKLPEDNKIGSILKLYNIVRDLRSEYIINGKYTSSIFQMAVQKYISDLKEYDQIGENKEAK